MFLRAGDPESARRTCLGRTLLRDRVAPRARRTEVEVTGNWHASFPVDAYPALTKQEPEIAHRAAEVIEALQLAAVEADAFSEEAWKAIGPETKAIERELKSLGSLQSIELVKNDRHPSHESYVFRMEFDTALMLMRFVIDAEGRISDLSSLAHEDKGRELASPVASQ